LFRSCGEEWLSRWLESRVSLRASTSRGYAAHVRSLLTRTAAIIAAHTLMRVCLAAQ
jgi:hypothetical protein